MIQKLNKILYLILFCLLFVLHSCQKDDVFDDTTDKENPAIQKISFDHFLNETNTLHLNFTAFSKKILLENMGSKINNNLSIQVDKNKVTKITRPNGLYTYTFNVTTNDTDPTFHFYKLVLITQNGKYDLKLLKFVPTGLANNQNQFEGTITQIQFTSNPLAQKGCDLAITLEPVWMACSNHGYYEAIQGVCAGGHWEMQVGHVTVCDGSTSGGTGETEGNPWDPSTISDGGTATYNGSYPVDVNQQVDAYFVLQAKFYSFTTTLSSTQQQYLETHLEVRDQIKKYLSENLDPNGEFTSESKQFVSELVNYCIANPSTNTIIKELIDLKIELNVNPIEILNSIQDYRVMMSEQEKNLFDTLNKLTQVRYLGCAKKAWDTAIELFPVSVIPSNLHNGRGDAFRHAYWNGLASYYIGRDLTEQLTNAHENRPQEYTYQYKEVQMDLNNNYEGRRIADYSTVFNLKDNVLSQMILGNLYYLNNLGPGPDFLATYSSQLIRTNQ